MKSVPKFLFIIIAVMVSVIAGTMGVSGQNAASAEDRQYLVKVGDMAPDFEMKLPDGSKVKLSSLRGKIVMLQFTASWCGVCRKEMPHIEKEIWLIGQGRHFEIWSDAGWKAQQDAIFAVGDKLLPPGLENLAL